MGLLSAHIGYFKTTRSSAQDLLLRIRDAEARSHNPAQLLGIIPTEKISTRQARLSSPKDEDTFEQSLVNDTSVRKLNEDMSIASKETTDGASRARSKSLFWEQISL